MLSEEERSAVGICPLFAALDSVDVDQLIDDRSIVTLRRAQQLFEHGGPATHFYLILNGDIKLTRLAADGEEAVVNIFGPGDTFAEAAMFMGGRYPVSATAVSDSRLIAVSYARLRVLFAAKPEAAFAMMASMARHIKLLVGQIEQMKLMTAKERVIQFLLDRFGQTDGATEFQLPYDKALIANSLGMKPETLSRALAQLADHGVRMTGSHVTIADVGHLSSLVSLK